MNSNYLYIFIITFLIASCGVKSPPLKHPEIAIDSYIQDYTGTDDHIQSDESKKQNESKK